MTNRYIDDLTNKYRDELTKNPDLIFIWHSTKTNKESIKNLYRYIKKCFQELEQADTFNRMTTCNRLSTISGISRPTIKKYLPVIMIECINEIKKFRKNLNV